MEKKIKLATAEGKNKEIFKALPPKVCVSRTRFSAVQRSPEWLHFHLLLARPI